MYTYASHTQFRIELKSRRTTHNGNNACYCTYRRVLHTTHTQKRFPTLGEGEGRRRIIRDGCTMSTHSERLAEYFFIIFLFENTK